MTPSRINGTTVGETISVIANVTDVTALDTIETGITWSNTTVAQCTDVTYGSFFGSIGASNIIGLSGTIDNTHGVVTPYSWAMIGDYFVSGSGAIFNFTFTIEHVGYSDVHFSGLWLENTSSDIIPINFVDYSTIVRGGQQYIVKFQGNPTQSSAVPPDNSGFYEENVTSMSPKTIGGVADLVGNMTFAINGSAADNGPFGYFNVTIPNNLMNCSGNNDNWVVELNNGTGPKLQGQRTVSSSTGTTTISLAGNYYPSGFYATIIVNIYGTSIAVPEFASTFSSTLLATVLVLATLVAALFIVITRSRKRKS
jgi:hypothetical protein